MGTNVVQLTKPPTANAFGIFSPDGTKIAFVSTRDYPSPQIYLMNADGSNVVRLTKPPGRNVAPHFFPDGKRIALLSDRNRSTTYGKSQIYTMNIDGSQITSLFTPSGDVLALALSPDGLKITFTLAKYEGYGQTREAPQIYVMNVDGLDAVRLTNTPGRSNASSVFSPDGSKIAFSSNRDGTEQIYLMNADGTNPIRLTSPPGQSYLPVFSP